PTTDDEFIGSLVVAGLLTLGLLAPRGHRMAAAGSSAFAAAHGVIDGVHGYAADLGTLAQPTGPTRRTADDLVVIHIAHAANGGLACRGQEADFAGGKLDMDHVAFPGHDFSLGSGGAGHLRAF